MKGQGAVFRKLELPSAITAFLEKFAMSTTGYTYGRLLLRFGLPLSGYVWNHTDAFNF
ncbi:hypothetical protein COO91_04396 [Nostoc flagelliforme CCNUN1]|uniref:Uncharacterized protein n=1 Tax=Nostoc flagelliforme CCNUN1 TaxID=2038116 RepID=A0A2K8SSJ8_9NOSO|nr:hypothetical protein COO91_04396 [Nostoc flagelliforme CCNUN1]